MKSIMYIGWIPDWPWNRRKWRKLGIEGEMRYTWKPTAFSYGAFEHCRVSPLVMKRLLDKGLLVYPDAFTAVYVEQLPGECQLWGGAPVQMDTEAA